MSFRFKLRWQNARANAQEIGRSLHRLGIPGKDVSNAVPCLFRSTMAYKKSIRERFLISIPLSLIFLAPYFWIFIYGGKSDESNVLNRLGDPDVLEVAVSSLFAIMGVLVFFMPPRRYLLEGRLAGSEHPRRKGQDRTALNAWLNALAPLTGEEMRPLSRLSNRLVGALNIVFFGMAGIIFSFIIGYDKLWYAGVDVILLVSYFAAIMYLSTKLVNVIFRWRLPPDVALVHELLLAYTLAYPGRAAEWRSFAHRRRIAHHLGDAASILEGPMLRILLGNENSIAGAIVRSNIRAAAAGLRQKLSWLATPKADTREHLARVIGEALIVAATGDLDRFLGSEIGVLSGVHIGWRDHLIAVGRWAIVGLGPAFAVFLGWRWVTDPAVRTLAVQFASVCFLSATFASVVQKGDERLSSIVNIGGSIFGWSKPRG